MTPQLVELWRHPIKAIGRERIAQADLSPGACLPGDRIWAVAHAAARLDGDGWQHCRNFIRAASSPALMAVDCDLSQDHRSVTLRHPDRPPLTVTPDEEPEALINWVAPLVADGRPTPTQVFRANDRGLTDSGTAGVTICNRSSHRAVEQKLGRPLSPLRWRGNLWLDGLAPWEEFDWIDRELRIGTATLRVYGRTGRCRATESNPDTGLRDTDTLSVLREWGHTDFSVKAEIISGGTIREGDEVTLL